MRNWYRTFKIVIAQAGISSEIIKNPQDGKDYFCLLGNTFPVKSQLMSVGFKWNANRRLWFMDAASLMGNSAAQNALRTLNISLSPLQSEVPAPTPQQSAPVSIPPIAKPKMQPGQKLWFLATLTGNGLPVCVSKEANGWNWVDEKGQTGLFSNEEAMAGVKSVRDDAGKNISSIDPQELFGIFKSKNEEQNQTPDKPTGSAPGRIPDELISQHQKAVRTTFLDSDKNILINALAGTGKTTLLRDLASFKDPKQKWLYLVFNKKNQVEASTGKGKFPNGVEVLTSHAFLGRVLGRSADLNAVPYTDLWNQGGERISAILDSAMEYDQTFPNGLKFAAMKTIKQVTSLAKAFAINPNQPDAAEQINKIIETYAIDCDLSTEKVQSDVDWRPQIVDKALDLLHACLPGNSGNAKFEGMRDHDDTLWYAATNSNVSWPKYDVVLADEVQDFNKCQTIMLQKLAQAGARIVSVGDPNQCQPAGTMVSMTGGEKKPIEQIKIGDEVVTYNSKKSYFPGVNNQGRKVIKIASRPYEGELVTIKTANYNHQCTLNHKCVVRFTKSNNYVMYLMTKGNQARIGIAKIKYFQSFGPSVRALQEGADRLWVLDAFPSLKEARIAEIHTSCLYGLPQLIFKHAGQKTGSQSFIDSVYNKIGNNLDKAKTCLLSFGREFDFPLWTKEEHERYGKLKQNYIGSSKSFITQACNLLSDIMQVRTYDNKPKGGNWENINVSREKVKCDVYSLEVEPTEDGKRLYIANNIVTHNSIYMFRGADANAFTNIQGILDGSKTGGAQHALPVNYRSGKKIIEYVNQNTHVKNLVAGRDFDGLVTEGVHYDEAMNNLYTEFNQNKRLKMQTAFIARTNAPLVKAALGLMKNGVDFMILGRDFSKEMIDHVDRIAGKGRWAKKIDILDFEDAMDKYMSNIEHKWRGKLSKAAELKELKDVTDSVKDVIMYLGLNNFVDPNIKMQVKDSDSFKKYLQARFGGVNTDNAEESEKLKQKDPLSYVTLTSAHRSKGMEYDRVFILKNQLFPHPRAKTPEALHQEDNARYVAYTRAMKELHVLNHPDEDKKGDNIPSASAIAPPTGNIPAPAPTNPVV